MSVKKKKREKSTSLKRQQNEIQKTLKIYTTNLINQNVIAVEQSLILITELFRLQIETLKDRQQF